MLGTYQEGKRREEVRKIGKKKVFVNMECLKKILSVLMLPKYIISTHILT